MRARTRRPSSAAVRRTGLGLVLGIAGGWIAGLLRVPKEPRG